MSKRNLWRLGFLGVTVLALTGELVASFDSSEETEPWTVLIITFIPWEVGVAALGALVLWVPIHFYVRYRKKHKRVVTREEPVPKAIRPYLKPDISDEEFEEIAKKFREAQKKPPTVLE